LSHRIKSALAAGAISQLSNVAVALPVAIAQHFRCRNIVRDDLADEDGTKR
jgi:hypothetical protein